MAALRFSHPRFQALLSLRKAREAVVTPRLRASLVLQRVACPSRRRHEVVPTDDGSLGLTVSLVPSAAAGATRLSTVRTRACQPRESASSHHARATV